MAAAGSEDERMIATGVRGRAIYLNYPYRKVSTIYLNLAIKDAGVLDSANYTCHAKTRLDKATSNSAQLKVMHRTKLVKQPNDAAAVLGGDTQLLCKVFMDSALIEDAEFYWTKNKQPTSDANTKVKQGSSEMTWSISYLIEYLTEEDIGEYQCHIITPYDSVHSEVAEINIMSETKITRHPSNVTVDIGGVAQFRLRVEILNTKK